MPNFLQMNYLGSTGAPLYEGGGRGFAFRVQHPNSGSVSVPGVWVRARFALSSQSVVQNYATFDPAYLMGVYMKVSGTSAPGTQTELVLGSVTQSYVQSQGISVVSSPDYIAPGYSNISMSGTLTSGVPIDAICFIGKLNTDWRVKWWIGEPKTGIYQLVQDRLVVQTTFTGTLNFDYFEFNDQTDQSFSENISPSWMRLYGWEVISSSSTGDPYGLLAGTSSFALSGTILSSRFIGDDFSSYSSKNTFTSSVGIVVGVNARDQGSPVIPNLNYQGVGIYGGFYDSGLTDVSGTQFLFSRVDAYLPWRFVSSSTDSSGTNVPFSGSAIWQLCNSNGTRISPSTIAMYISGSWNTGSIQGYPAIGIFEYTNSVSESTWQQNASGGLIRYWASYPGAYTDVTELSMSLRSILDGTFYVPIPSGSYGVSVDYANYGFYPTKPIDVSASIIDVL